MTEEAKRYAEATFMKKKMYYNMRIKTIKRTFSAIIKISQKAHLIKKDFINENIARLESALASFVRHGEEEISEEDKTKTRILESYIEKGL